MIEQLMSSSLSGDYESCATRVIRIHVPGLRFNQMLTTQLFACARSAAPTNNFRSIRYFPDPVPAGTKTAKRQEQPESIDGVKRRKELESSRGQQRMRA